MRTIGEPSAFQLHEWGAQVFSYLHCKIWIGCSCQHLRAILRELSVDSFAKKYQSLDYRAKSLQACGDAGQRHKELFTAVRGDLKKYLCPEELA